MQHKEETYFWVSLGESWPSMCGCVCLFVGGVGWKVRFIPVGDCKSPKTSTGSPLILFLAEWALSERKRIS